MSECRSVLVVTGYVPKDTVEWPCENDPCDGRHMSAWVTWTDSHSMAVKR